MTLYTAAKNDLLTGAINFSTDDIRCILIDAADYTFSAAHTSLTDVPSAARVATSGALASKTVTGGAFDAADVVLSAVTGDASEGILVYKHTGTESTSRLIEYKTKRSDGTTDIAITPNGGDITISWASAGIVVL